MTEHGVSIPAGDLAGFYDSLPSGRPTGCYQCGHEGGELTGRLSGFPGRCVDRESCERRIVAKRAELSGGRFGVCGCCGEHGPVIVSRVSGFIDPEVACSTEDNIETTVSRGCVDSPACNRRCCERDGHALDVTHLALGRFPERMARVGGNEWVALLGCLRCGETLGEKRYRDGDRRPDINDDWGATEQ